MTTVTTVTTVTLRWGTSHFRTKRHAVRYYARQDETAADVERKLAEGLIHLGAPRVNTGESFEWDRDGRAVITGAR